MAEKTFAAFFSYVHQDDDHDNGRLTKIREWLEGEISAQTGESFEIFQDRDDIHWGHAWEQRINGTLDGCTFLIAAITPRYLRSAYCRKEFLRFTEREKELSRHDLILPLLYMDTPGLEDADDPVAVAISSRQYADWRSLRFEPWTNPDVTKRLSQLAKMVCDAMARGALQKSAPLSRVKAVKTVQKESSVTEQPTETTAHKPSAPVEPLTLVVDPMPRRGDFTTIVSAIEYAESGTRILIRPGLYKETLVLEKPLELIGDGKCEEIIIEARAADIILFKTEFGRISNLTIRQAGKGRGVDISQGRLELEDCDITSQSFACIAIHEDADPRLRRNRIHDGKQSGIYVYENGKGTVEDNEIFGNKYRGVTIERGGNPTLRRNRIYSNEDGVLVWKNGKGILEDNEIFGNLESGVVVTTEGDPILRRNRIHDEKHYGVLVSENGKGTFEENEIFTSNFGCVTIASGSDPILRYNLIYNGVQSGIFIIDEGNGTIEDNEITGNAYSGVEITRGGNPILRRNVIKENGNWAIYIYDNGGGIFENNDLRNNMKGAWNIDNSSRKNTSGSDNIAE